MSKTQKTLAAVANDTDELAEKYDADSDYQFKAALVFIAELILFLQAGKRDLLGMRILDVGCGTGRITHVLSVLVGDRGMVKGIDPSKIRITVANRKYGEAKNLEFAAGHAEATDCDPDSFDIVFTNASFHWVSDQEKALSEFRRVTKPGGTIAVAARSGDHSRLPLDARNHVLAMERYRGYPLPADSGPFPLKRSECETLLDKVGLPQRRFLLKESTPIFENGEALVKLMEESWFGLCFGHLPEPLQPMARRDLIRRIDDLYENREVALVSARLLIFATKSDIPDDASR